MEEPALAAAGRLLEEVSGRHRGVRWVRPGGLHLTVHFFGHLDRQDLGALVDLVRPVAAPTVAFDVVLDHLGAFPPRGRPRVLWLGAGEGSDRLGVLAAGCRRVLAAAGIPVEDRPFAAHVTLGRPGGEPPVDRAAWTGRTVGIPAFAARRLVLYESVPGPGGAVYTPLSEVPFRG